MDSIIFYHTYLVNDYKNLVQDQLAKVFASGLYEECTEFYIGINHNNLDDAYWLTHLVSPYSKIRCYVHGENQEENGTLKLISDIVQNRDCHVAYFHTKAITNLNYSTQCWRRMLDHFTISKWRDSKALLNEYDAVGAMFRQHPAPHFSGNYWWANSNYIHKLDNTFITPAISPHGRFGAEFWIGSGANLKLKCIHDYHGTNPYNENFEINNYL